jgi:hypothetical protein
MRLALNLNAGDQRAMRLMAESGALVVRAGRHP